MTRLHMMVDLETIGSGADAAIAEIGAAAFELPGDGIAGEPFSVHVDLDDCLRCGLKIDVATVYWWMHQDNEARKRFGAAERHGLKLRAACGALTMFYADRVGDGAPVWAHGGAFDLPILATAFRAVRLPLPWKYWQGFDTRTLLWLAGNPPRPSVGVKHSAVDDVIAQVSWLQRAYDLVRPATIGEAPPASPVSSPASG